MKNTANRFGFDKETQGLYRFFDEDFYNWKTFWQEFGGNKKEILGWAKEAEIKNPESWYNSLYCFLFGVFSGDVSLLTKTAKAKYSFFEFLAKAAENHVQTPKDKWWYINKGTTNGKFVGILQTAASYVDNTQAIKFLNGKFVDLGFRLYDEYVLSLSGVLEDLKKEASALNKKAYDIETKAGMKKFESGQDITYLLAPELKLSVIEDVDNTILARTDKNTLSLIVDKWNVK